MIKKSNIRIVVNAPIKEVYPSMQPELGRVYHAVQYCNTTQNDPSDLVSQFKPFVVITLRSGKPLILRYGEYKEVNQIDNDTAGI